MKREDIDNVLWNINHRLETFELPLKVEYQEHEDEWYLTQLLIFKKDGEEFDRFSFSGQDAQTAMVCMNHYIAGLRKGKDI